MNRTSCVALILSLICGICQLEAFDGAANVEVRAAAFFPASSRCREVYGNVSPDFQIQAAASYCGCYEVWTNVDCFYHYRRQNSCCNSSETVINGSVGLNYVIPFCGCMDAYAGIGAAFGHIILKNETCCRDERVSKYAFGGVLKSGMRYYFDNCVFVDLFFDYIYQPVHFHKTIDVGGPKLGLGLGTSF